MQSGLGVEIPLILDGGGDVAGTGEGTGVVDLQQAPLQNSRTCLRPLTQL